MAAVVAPYATAAAVYVHSRTPLGSSHPRFLWRRAAGVALHLGDGVAGFLPAADGRGLTVNTQGGKQHAADLVMLVRPGRCTDAGERLAACLVSAPVFPAGLRTQATCLHSLWRLVGWSCFHSHARSGAPHAHCSGDWRAPRGGAGQVCRPGAGPAWRHQGVCREAEALPAVICNDCDFAGSLAGQARKSAPARRTSPALPLPPFTTTTNLCAPLSEGGRPHAHLRPPHLCCGRRFGGQGVGRPAARHRYRPNRTTTWLPPDAPPPPPHPRTQALLPCCTPPTHTHPHTLLPFRTG